MFKDIEDLIYEYDYKDAVILHVSQVPQQTGF